VSARSGTIVALAVVLTMRPPLQPYRAAAPLSKAFTTRHVHWAADIVAIGSVTTLTATTVCSLLGQPRIFYRMAKDGLYYQ
jgi:APA family basic amino acid/polyamine antiporter